MNISISNLYTDDEAAFKDFFDEYYQGLCMFANSYLSDNALAADIVQETFVKLWTERRHFEGLPQLKSFLYTVVRNACLNKIRNGKGKRTDLTAISDSTFFHNTLIEEETYRLLYKAIDHLPSQSRKIIELALDGKKNAEIATALGIQENTVLTLKKIAYRKLRASLGKYYYLLFLIIMHDLHLH